MRCLMYPLSLALLAWGKPENWWKLHPVGLCNDMIWYDMWFGSAGTCVCPYRFVHFSLSETLPRSMHTNWKRRMRPTSRDPNPQTMLRYTVLYLRQWKAWSFVVQHSLMDRKQKWRHWQEHWGWGAMVGFGLFSARMNVNELAIGSQILAHLASINSLQNISRRCCCFRAWIFSLGLKRLLMACLSGMCMRVRSFQLEKLGWRKSNLSHKLSVVESSGKLTKVGFTSRDVNQTALVNHWNESYHVGTSPRTGHPTLALSRHSSAVTQGMHMSGKRIWKSWRKPSLTVRNLIKQELHLSTLSLQVHSCIRSLQQGVSNLAYHFAQNGIAEMRRWFVLNHSWMEILWRPMATVDSSQNIVMRLQSFSKLPRRSLTGPG